MRKKAQVFVASALAALGLAVGASQASALTTVNYAVNHGLSMGKSNLLSTTGFENRTYNSAWRSINTGVNVPLMVRQLLSGGGELLNPAGGALNSIYFDLGPYSNPHSKSQCWIPTNGSTPSGIVSCQTTRP